MNKIHYFWNLAGYNWKRTCESWNTRLDRAIDYLRQDDPWVIGLAEFIPGKNNHWITYLQNKFPDYLIILPHAYNNNFRSAITLLLIRKKGVRSYTIRTLDGSGLDKSLLYVYISLDTDFGFFRILCAHFPNTSNKDRPQWFQKERDILRNSFENAVAEISSFYIKEPDIQFIMLADMNASPESSYIRMLSGYDESPLFNATRSGERHIPTWNNPDISNNHLDYIFYGKGSLYSNVIDPYYNDIIVEPMNTLIPISDHALIKGSIFTNLNSSS